MKLSRDQTQVNLYTGPMFSGKTDEMLRQIRIYDHIKSALVILLKPGIDNRTGESRVLSRSGAERDADARVSTGEEAWEIVNKMIADRFHGKDIIAIGIDEGQFINGLDFFVKKVLEVNHETYKIHLHIAALTSKFTHEMWEEVVKIIPYCHSVIKYSAICGICEKRDAQLTKRLVESDDLILIGSDEYAASCYECSLNK